MKTHDEFKEDVDYLARVAREYADEVTVEFDIDDPDEPENDLATLTMEFSTEETFKVEFRIWRHETVIVGDRDTDIYLNADEGGFYAYLFMTCLYRLQSARAK